MRRKLRPTIVVVVVVIAVLVVVIAVRAHLARSKAPAQRTVAARRGNLTVSVQETGSIESKEMVNVDSKVAGRIVSLPVVEGQYVAKGQLIATVDRTLIDPQIAGTQAQLDEAESRLQQSVASYRLQQVQTQTAISQAQAGLLSARAHLATVKAGSRPQELAQQEQAVARAQITLDDANRTLARRNQLLAKGFIAQADVDSAQVASDTAASSLAAEKQQLNLLQAGPRRVDIREAAAAVNTAQVQLDSAKAASVQNLVSKSNIAQSQANVEQIQNQLGQLEVQLADTRIVAPSSGIVLKKFMHVNEIVQSATTSFSSSDSTVCVLGNKPEVDVSVNEVDLEHVFPGALVRVTVDALPGAVFAGRVASIAPVSTNAVTSNDSTSSSSSADSVAVYPVKITFVHPDPRLRPGMTAEAQIIDREVRDVVIVPLETIPFSGDKGDVRVLGAQGKPIPVPVRLGLRNDVDVEVVSGLAPGQKLIVNKIDGSDRRKIQIGGGQG